MLSFKKAMHGLLIGISISICLAATPALAEPVQVALPSFPVSLNGVTMVQKTSQYPLLVYRDITYVPMTYHDARLLGLETAWGEATGLAITSAKVIPAAAVAQTNYKPYTQEQENAATYQATLATGAIQVAGTSIDNSTEPYPLLVFRDVTYFPLTWAFAVDKFGWTYSFDGATGLVIAPKPTPVVTPPAVSEQQEVGLDAKVYQITGDVVNIRAGAGTNHDVVAQVKRGDQVTVIAQKGDWYKIKLNAQNQVGWVANWLVSASGTQSPVPVIGGSTSSSNSIAHETDASPSNVSETATEPVLVPPHQLALLEVKQEFGQAWATYDIGNHATVKVLSNEGGKLVVLIDNTTMADPLGNPVVGIPPFGSFILEAVGDRQVRITTTVSQGGYFRLDLRNNRFSIMAVAKHKNGQTGLAGKTIVIDPGHGNYGTGGVVDPGAIGRVLGFTDREVGHTVGLKLKAMLESAGVRVMMTRELEPVTISLAQRAYLANDNSADAFISIHGNSYSNPEKYGAEVYYFTGNIRLTSAAQKDVRTEFAKTINKGIANTTGRPSVTKTANFAVNREAEMPSILVEAGYLSNAEDEALLATDAYQTLMAQGIYNGLADYFSY